MKAIILAAGKGSRLAQGDLPKPLTLLSSGHSILELQLKTLETVISLHDVIIVVGYHKEMIIERFPDLCYVYNPQYAEENTSKSLLRAFKKCHEDVLWLNGDVVFHPSILPHFLQLHSTAMVVNNAVVGSEEVKYRTDAVGNIIAVSKHVEAAQGEALGVNYCAANDLPLLCHHLEQCAPNDYFEAAIEKAIEHGMKVKSFAIPNDLCTEIDFPEDLAKANMMVSQWNA